MASICHQAGKGTKHSVTTGRFQEAEPHRLLSGDESEERTVPSCPLPPDDFFMFNGYFPILNRILCLE
jgi:hypothetical protein